MEHEPDIQGSRWSTLVLVSARNLFPEHAILVFFLLLAAILWSAYGAVDFHGIRGFSVRTSFGVLVFFVAMAYLPRAKTILTGNREDRVAANRRALVAVRQWLPFALAVLVYENLHDMTNLIRTDTVDDFLMQLDQAIFGIQPTVWMDEHLVTPLFTDYMGFAYSLYFFLPAGIGLAVYIQRDERSFRTLSIAVLLTQYLGFLGYITVPAIGPRFWIADQYSHQVLAGYVFSNASELFMPLEACYRDCFPSLHTAVSSVSLWYAWRFKDVLPKGRLWFWIYLPLVVSLWFSTVYLRQHWVVDVFAGWILAAFTVAVSPKIVELYLSARERILVSAGYSPGWKPEDWRMDH